MKTMKVISRHLLAAKLAVTLRHKNSILNSPLTWPILTVLLAGFISTEDLFAATLLGPEKRVIAADADNSDWFGHAVDIDGNIAVIGAHGDDEFGTNAGAAYVFSRQGGIWTQVTKLNAGIDANDFDEFGFAVAIEQNLIAVGARWDDEADVDAGAVYLFEWDGLQWNHIEKLMPNDMSGNAAYGYGSAVDIGIATPENGSVELTDVVVGAPRADNFQGVVFLVEKIGPFWQTIGRFSDSDNIGLNDKGEFGTSLEIKGDALAIGAPMDDQNGSNSGAAYVFSRANINNIWTESTTYFATNPSAGDHYGFDVAIDENILVVGAPGSSGTMGQVFIYDFNNIQSFNETATGEGFGNSVALDLQQKSILVGSKNAQFSGPSTARAGAAYFYQRNDLGTWLYGGHLVASDVGINKLFGESVAMQAGSAIIGGSESDAFTPGAAYLYTELIFKNGFNP